MNPLILLFSLLGLGGMVGATSSSSGSTVPSQGNVDDEDTDDTGDMGDDTGDHGDHGDMGDDTGDDDTGEDTDDTGDDDTGEDTDDHGDHGDMGDDTGDDDTGEDTGDTGDDDTGEDADDHGGHGDMGDDTGDDDTGEDTGDDGDHGGHGDHDDPLTATITPPGVGASASEINAYLNALASQGDMHSHSDDAGMASEHMTALGLVERGEATHVAIGDGDWNDPSIWSGGEVPGDDAKVLIPEGVTVDYSAINDARLFTVRVDGKLDFATDTDSQMIFDTMVVAPSGILEIGTASDPVDADVNIDLIVANNGKIDTNWDPELLSRGIVAHGKTSIYGAEKDSHEKVVDDPMAGDTSVKFASTPEGWQVGDTIVIAGTHYDGHNLAEDGSGKTYHEPEDEERVITKIGDDGTIYFDDPLVHDHDTPRADLKTSVANYTRNVSVETENAETAEVYERGHVMFMHNDDVDVRYAEFHELGRTDKSEDALKLEDINNVQYDSNVQGRYSLHLHRAGTEDFDNPAILEGNAVYGSPGWGVVHHDSHAVLDNNATYDTFGAGFVSETGNETGIWNDNIAIDAEGTKWAVPKNTSDWKNLYDIAKGGDGFWLQSRMIEVTDNVAASVAHGFVFFHRDGTDTMIPASADQFDFAEALYFKDSLKPEDMPIRFFEGNETFAAYEGMHVVKENTTQGHDVWTHLKDFTAWEVEKGAHLQYTSHYIVENFDVIGKEDSGYSKAQFGILFGNNISDMVVIDATIDGFKTGMSLTKHFVQDASIDRHDYVIIDAEIKNTQNDYANYDPKLDTITTSDKLPMHEPDLDLGKLVYTDTKTYDTQVLLIEGYKTDGVGTIDFPNGLDLFRMRQKDIAEFLEEKGYYSTSDGQNYFLFDVHFTDRATGEVYYETHPVYLKNVAFGKGAFSDAVYNGQQNIVTKNGVEMAGDQVLDTAIPADTATFYDSIRNIVEETGASEHSGMVMMAAETLSYSAGDELHEADEVDTLEDMAWLSSDAETLIFQSEDTAKILAFYDDSEEPEEVEVSEETDTVQDDSPEDVSDDVVEEDTTVSDHSALWEMLTSNQGVASEDTPAAVEYEELLDEAV